MVINQMVNGRAGECSCTGHSTLRAQRTVLRIVSPLTIIGLCIDLRRENPIPFLPGFAGRNVWYRDLILPFLTPVSLVK